MRMQISVRLCPVCGKKFRIYRLDDWKYKVWLACKDRKAGGDARYYCSYTCARAHEKRLPEPYTKQADEYRGSEQVYSAYGLTMTLPEWAERAGMPEGEIKSFMDRGFTLPQIVRFSSTEILNEW